VLITARKLWYLSVVLAVVAGLAGVGAADAGAKTKHKHKPKPKIHLLGQRLQCTELLQPPDWGPHIIATDPRGGNPCVFGLDPSLMFAEPPIPFGSDALPYPPVMGGSLICDARNGKKWARAASHPHGGNLLPARVRFQPGPGQRPLVRLSHVGTRAEIFDPPETGGYDETIGYVQVDNALCFVQVINSPGFEPDLNFVAKTRFLMTVVAAELER
jgi:hypothetical protein